MRRHVSSATAQRRHPARGSSGGRTVDRRDAVAVAFGAHVRSLRLKAGLRQIDLAGPALSRAAIAKIEGGSSSPSLATVAHLAWVLDVPLRRLIPQEL